MKFYSSELYPLIKDWQTQFIADVHVMPFSLYSILSPVSLGLLREGLIYPI